MNKMSKNIRKLFFYYIFLSRGLIFCMDNSGPNKNNSRINRYYNAYDVQLNSCYNQNNLKNNPNNPNYQNYQNIFQNNPNNIQVNSYYNQNIFQNNPNNPNNPNYQNYQNIFQNNRNNVQQNNNQHEVNYQNNALSYNLQPKNVLPYNDQKVEMDLKNNQNNNDINNNDINNIDDIDAIIAKLKAENRLLYLKIEKFQSSIDEMAQIKLSEIKKHEKNYTLIQNEKTYLEKTLEECKAKLVEYEIIINNLKASLNKANFEAQENVGLIALQKKNQLDFDNELKKKIKDLEENFNQDTEKLSKKFKDNLQQKESEHDKRIGALHNLLKTVQKKLKESKDNAEKSSKAYEASEKTLQSVWEQCDTLKKDLHNLKEEKKLLIGQLDTQKLEYDNLQNNLKLSTESCNLLNTKIDSLEKNLKVKIDEYKNLKKLFTKATKDYGTLHQQLVNITNENLSAEDKKLQNFQERLLFKKQQYGNIKFFMEESNQWLTKTYIENLLGKNRSVNLEAIDSFIDNVAKGTFTDNFDSFGILKEIWERFIQEDKEFASNTIKKLTTVEQLKNLMLVFFEENIVPVKLITEYIKNETKISEDNVEVDHKYAQKIFEDFFTKHYQPQLEAIFDFLKEKLLPLKNSAMKYNHMSSFEISKEKLQALSPANIIILNTIREKKIKKIFDQERLKRLLNEAIQAQNEGCFLNDSEVVVGDIQKK